MFSTYDSCKVLRKIFRHIFYDIVFTAVTEEIERSVYMKWSYRGYVLQLNIIFVNVKLSSAMLTELKIYMINDIMDLLSKCKFF